MARRVERFALQSVARDILPDSRTAKCLRIRAHDRDAGVEVQEAQDCQLWRSANLRQRLGVSSLRCKRWWNVAGVKYSRQWPSIAPVAAKCIC